MSSNPKPFYTISSSSRRLESSPKLSQSLTPTPATATSWIRPPSPKLAVRVRSPSQPHSQLTSAFIARLLTKLNSSEAEEAWHTLLERNSDCYNYYTGYLASKGHPILPNTPSQPNPAALEIISALTTEFPRARASKRLGLVLSEGDEFKRRAEEYIKSSLVKGIPSLFSDLKSLYTDEAKCAAIEEIAERLQVEFKEASSTPSGSEEPTTYLWTLYLLAQHHSALGRHQKALELLEEALTHTPTLPELHLFKGRVLKRVGDLLGAAACVNDARLLDGQDRFLNTKTGKYLLRAGCVKEASDVFGLFTKVFSILILVFGDAVVLTVRFLLHYPLSQFPTRPHHSGCDIERRSKSRRRPRRHAVHAIPPGGSQSTRKEWPSQSRAQEVHGRQEGVFQCSPCRNTVHTSLLTDL